MDLRQDDLLDVTVANERAGFRLHRFEVYNWGTFHSKVWVLNTHGDNALLTGDIGSGKSTLVDAITTLLVPAQKIIYNKAAGAENKERTLKSYVLGHYKSERADAGQAARPVALRDHNNYAVLLGYFRNEGFNQQVTLAQVFWIKAGEGQPQRFYVVADSALSIAEHFADFGSDIHDLKKRLRRTPQLEVHDSFPLYGAAFRRRFGISNEQAMDLFNQTVSMKSIGNLTDFVRDHMLEAFPVEGRIEALIHHFDDLNRAHEAIIKAKAQIELLQPLVVDCDRYTELQGQMQELRACREALKPWFAQLKGELLLQRITTLEAELLRLEVNITTLTEQRRNEQTQRDELKRAIADNGGDRIERIAAELSARLEEKARRLERAAAYTNLARALQLPEPRAVETFLTNLAQLKSTQQAAHARRAEVQNLSTEVEVEFRQLKESHDQLSAEISSLRQRRSNIDSEILAIRERLCGELGVDNEELPFAGELLRVRDDASDWEGAAERLLRSFGRSLLVSETWYVTLAEWVDRTHLRGRLIYYRVRAPRNEGLSSLAPQSLVHKLAVKSESEFYPWLEAEVTRRFDYVCCDTLEQFRREKQAITRSGQIKGGGERHDKDDRYRIDDRTRYILGWSNTAKIAALEKKTTNLERRLQEIGARIAALLAERNQLDQRLREASQLEMFSEFREIDWQSPAVEIERLQQEKARLEAASDILRSLTQHLAVLEENQSTTDSCLSQTKQDEAVTRSKCTDAQQLLQQTQDILAALASDIVQRIFPLLATMRTDALGTSTLTVENCDSRQTDLREWLQAKIDAEQRKLDRLREKIIKAMGEYSNTYQLDTQEVDVALEAADTYRRMLAQLQADDLPRFEAQFKQLLNENTIREVANFQAQLHRERQAIRERIDIINRSLHAIDYHPNRYIALLAENSPDVDVRDFQQQLRACTEGTMSGSEAEQYNEAKFLEVKIIVERFRGREGTTELDRRWTRRVTDVRNWFVFSTSERWREGDHEYENYTDSGGKSGGQKEKLAYTVLAASLAYQFGLEWGETRSRSFRFVVIDEAFGRGSDESARYGLQLFQQLNLQLLIVTPLQKIHIIEPFVASVGFVHNPDGQQSLLRNLSIEEYRAEKAARSAEP